jgi:AsmA protein
MVQIRSLDIALRPWRLLHGVIEIDHVVLTGPQIALEVDRQGRPNWAFAGGQAAPAAGGGGGGGGAAHGVMLADVRIADGKVTYADRRSGSTTTLDRIDLRLARPDPAGALSVTGSARWNGEAVKLLLDVPHPREAINGGTSALTLKLSAAPVTVAVTGRITALPPKKLGGEIDLAMPSLRRFAAWTGASLAPTGSGLGPLAIKGHFEHSGDTIAFTNATLALDAIRAKGNLTLDTAGARPAIKGRLDTEMLDLNPYLPAEAPAGGGKAAPGAPAKRPGGWSDAPIEVSALRAADANLDLAATALRYRKLEITRPEIAVVLKAGRLEARLKHALLYGGGGSGRLAVDGSTDTPAVALAANLDRVQVGPLIEALAGRSRLRGTGKLELDVSGAGRSQRAIIGALNGKGALDLRDGEIAGVNLIGIAQNALTAVTGGASGGDVTKFGALTGTFRIEKGILRNDDMLLTDGPVPVKGAGTANLPERTLDYRAMVQLSAAAVPVLIKGPWDNLHYGPDTGAIVKEIAKDPGKALEQLQQLPQSLPGTQPGTSNPLQKLFGR